MKYVLCVLSALICAVTAFPHIPGLRKEPPPQCRDPTFACQDLASARLCGVVKTCIHDIWSTMHVPDDNDEVCDICKEMVKEARDQLLSNMTQEEIKEVFEGSCKLLPVKLVADACIKVVDEIIPELVEMLASRMDPTMVCTVSGMCFATRSPFENRVVKLFRVILSKNKDSSQCSECTALVTETQNFLNHTPASEVTSYLENFCHQKMPSYLCNLIISHYLPDIYDYLKSNSAESICSNAGVCPKKCGLEETKVKDDLTCEFCEHLIEHVKDLITANSTAEEFRTALLNFCKQVGSYSDKCTSLVNDYFDMLFDYIRKVDSKGMCTLMGLCGNQECSKVMPLVKLIPAFEGRRRIPLIKLQPANQIRQNELNSIPLVRLIPSNVYSKKEMKESNDIFQPLIPLDKFVHPLPLLEKDTECALCKAFSFYLETDLSGDKSKDGVSSAIDGICGKWMVEFPDHCNSLIQKYSLKMQYAIAEGVSFEELCSNVKACPLNDKRTELMKVKIVKKAGPLCDLCKDALSVVEKELSDPAIKQKLKDMFDQGCSILPKGLRDDCVNFVNQNIDAVIDILQQELTPDNICPALKLCSGMPRVSVPQRVKDLECDVCKDVVSNFRQKLQDPTSKKIVISFLETACARLPTSVSAECRKFVDEQIDTIMKIMIDEMDPVTVCSMLSICPASLRKELNNPIKDVECELCKEVVGRVEDMVKDNKTEDEIKSALDKVCSYLPSSMAQKCDSFVNQYTDILIQLLTQELDPGMICAELNLCPSSLRKELNKPLKNIECALCKEVVGKVEDIVKDKRTEDEIKAALDEVCSLLPPSAAKKCDSFVNKYTDILIVLLTQELDPELICAELSLCLSSMKRPKRVKDLECDLCKEVVTKMEDLVKDQQTEAEIREAMDKLCSYLPSSVATKCESFVDKYVNLIITLLAQELDPGMVCSAMNVCPTVEHPNEIQLKSLEKAKDIECESCFYALHFLQNELMDSNTQGTVKNLLKKVCAILPTEYATNCNAFVEEYGSSLLVLLAQEIDPSQMCYQVKMCSNTTSFFKEEKVELNKFKLDECSLCTTVVDYLDKLLEEDDVDKEITDVVEKVCGVLPSSFKDKCGTMLETYGPYLLQMIGQLADSKQVCQDIDLCARPPTSVHLLGGSKCTFGPSYWCTSAAHASACKAEMYCKAQVWKN